jgi:hypothetical protein
VRFILMSSAGERLAWALSKHFTVKVRKVRRPCGRDEDNPATG